jgi:hypothetical protein
MDNPRKRIVRPPANESAGREEPGRRLESLDESGLLLTAAATATTAATVLSRRRQL